MEFKVLTNPSNKDILDYRVAEAQFDQDGKTILDSMTGSYVTTGRTLEWSIKAGETLQFPAYVADYLKKIYDFLKFVEDSPAPVSDSPKTEETLPPVSPITKNHVCQKCGQQFDSIKGKALHLAIKHPELI